MDGLWIDRRMVDLRMRVELRMNTWVDAGKQHSIRRVVVASDNNDGLMLMTELGRNVGASSLPPAGGGYCGLAVATGCVHETGV